MERESITRVILKVEAKLGGAQIKRSDIATLRVGDVIVLDHKLSEPVPITIGGKKCCHGRVGTYLTKRAVKIYE